MQSRARSPYMFWLFIVAWTLVHLNFERQFWLGADMDVFSKYDAAGGAAALAVGKKVYYTKATWMFALVWMQVLGLSLRSAVAWSFLLYSLELLFFFPVRLYALLNLLLAVGCVAEDLILRRSAPSHRMPEGGGHAG